MEYLVVKVKNRNLFFNADEGMGDYVCETPMLLDKEQADSIIKYAIDIYSIDGEKFTNADLEVKSVKLELI